MTPLACVLLAGMILQQDSFESRLAKLEKANARLLEENELLKADNERLKSIISGKNTGSMADWASKGYRWMVDPQSGVLMPAKAHVVYRRIGSVVVVDVVWTRERGYIPQTIYSGASAMDSVPQSPAPEIYSGSQRLQ